MNAIATRVLAGIALAMICLAPAWAVPVGWTLNGVTFNDGGTASGSFTYDADTNQFSAINIVTTTGTSVTGATFSFVCQSPCTGLTPNSSNALYLTTSSANDLTGTPGLALSFSPALSNAGGSAAVNGIQGVCSDANCASPAAPSRNISAGTVASVAATVSPTPAVSFTGLLGLGLGIMIVLLLSRKKIYWRRP